MTKTAIQVFVEEVMSIGAGYPGMGGASAGIIGASSTNDQIIDQLRKNILAFAAEYKQRAPDRERLVELGEKVEGSLYALKMTNAISDARLDKLTVDLHALIG